MPRINELYHILARRYNTHRITGWSCKDSHLFEVVKNCAVFGGTGRVR